MTKRQIPLAIPGEILLEEFLKPLRVTQYRLAKEIGVPHRRNRRRYRRAPGCLLWHGSRVLAEPASARRSRARCWPRIWLAIQPLTAAA